MMPAFRQNVAVHKFASVKILPVAAFVKQKLPLDFLHQLLCTELGWQ
jgi:hypothetical protein